MTQSGHGEDPHLPAVRQPREGIVLPADGSGPLVPGATGDRTAPAGGSPWGQPWGPDQAAQPPAAPAGAPQDAWAGGPGLPEAAPPQWGTPGAAPQPPAHTHQQYQQQYQQPYGAGPLPPQAPAAGPAGADAGPAGYAPAGPGAQAHGPQGGAAGPYGHAGPLPPAAHGGAPQPAGPGAMPPGGPGGTPPFGQHGAVSAADRGAPLPQAGYNGAPPQAGPGVHAAGSVDEAATQYLPPVGNGAQGGPGALPPEMPAESTQRLGRVPQHGRHAGPPPAQAQHPDNQPTQYIAPVPAPPPGAPYGVRPGSPGDGQGEDRQPPAEFDSLFRTRSEQEGAGATQQLPRFEQPQGAGHPGPGHPHGAAAAGAPGGYGGGAHEDGHGRAAGRRGGASRSKGPLIAALGIGIVVLGVGAGALLSGGGDGDGDGDKKTVSATAPTGGASAAPDPGQAQATELDKLLADSNNSRDTVIGAVDDVKNCKDLGKAATDLRNAAKQRNGLVTRLSGLSVDKLANHTRLTSALNEAWKASAAADNHYAAWADQVSGRHGCHKGHARNTPQVAAGNKASGDATSAKETAAGLWNAIAEKYGLTSRDKSEL
ncbi:hypothetical protein GCM10018793_00560 [Streptomyces sulfonofaciens]|uniref:Uncharacterized protein n=1 Tax=Streptomyces sulfonofaciens TaxID=68272 RepID=A0A919KQY5_9ACTN|nr:hypothetical protein [Streptomyces sulfonofaciens]GHH68952.1 hypothetical protein GCM10018793_00560 [Streptomyces sulfonofaciens]